MRPLFYVLWRHSDPLFYVLCASRLALMGLYGVARPLFYVLLSPVLCPRLDNLADFWLLVLINQQLIFYSQDIDEHPLFYVL